MTNILICGISGKMGKALYDLAQSTKDINVVCGVDKFASRDIACPIYPSFTDVAQKVDVIIDFSRPQAMPEILAFAKSNNAGVVFATTGYSVDELETIKAASKQLPIFISANFSLGVNLVAYLCKSAAKILGDAYDIEIIEKHHRMKVDSPSGTALFLADEINSAFSCTKEYVYGRFGNTLKRGSEIGIHAVRGGTIIGEHEVIFTANDETISIAHSAQSKTLFATGALRAAVFIKDKPAGFYRMESLLESIMG